MTNLSTIDILNDLFADLTKMDMATLTDGQLVPLVKAIKLVGSFSAAVDAEIYRRAVDNGDLLPGVVVEDTVTHRKWHDEEAAAQLAREEFGEKAFVTKLKSPAQIEKLGPQGKNFVAVASFKPEGTKKASY